MHVKAVLSGLVVAVLCSFIFSLGTTGAVKDKDNANREDQIQRGMILVLKGDCNQCHTPKVSTPFGTFTDHTRLLSGHPEDLELPRIPPGLIGPGKWFGLFTEDQTAWAGPWGVVFSANLTPDPETGIGKWTEDMFIKAIRTGKHKGFGREILPPMPWEDYAELSDEDLKAIFAYLRTLKPVKNKVPEPIPLVEGQLSTEH